MTTYRVKFTRQANRDIRGITAYIKNILYAPATAKQFLHGIYAVIARLESDAPIYAVSTYRDVLLFGNNARHIRYKDFTIIYTLHDDRVIIHRIIHSSLVKE
jgi:plasmid stabilization system protein ParE